jgi:hypothetical protein
VSEGGGGSIGSELEKGKTSELVPEALGLTGRKRRGWVLIRLSNVAGEPLRAERVIVVEKGDDEGFLFDLSREVVVLVGSVVGRDMGMRKMLAREARIGESVRIVIALALVLFLREN